MREKEVLGVLGLVGVFLLFGFVPEWRDYRSNLADIESETGRSEVLMERVFGLEKDTGSAQCLWKENLEKKLQDKDWDYELLEKDGGLELVIRTMRVLEVMNEVEGIVCHGEGEIKGMVIRRGQGRWEIRVSQ